MPPDKTCAPRGCRVRAELTFLTSSEAKIGKCHHHILKITTCEEEADDEAAQTDCVLLFSLQRPDIIDPTGKQTE